MINKKKRARKMQAITDVDLKNNSALDIAAWFTRQLIGVNKFPEYKVYAILSHCAAVKEIIANDMLNEVL